MDRYTLHPGDCLGTLRAMPACSVDSIVTDPPYGLSFMGKRWDYDVPSAEVWAECLRVLKPGGHLLAFAGTRTQHRMAVRIEDAGFEIRDMIAWVYGSGFPKSLDVSKAIDKAAGAERIVVSEGKAVKRMIPGADQNATGSWIKDNGREYVPTVTMAATDAAAQWQGWGTALKPALEPITVARKPLAGTVAANVLAHGAGALNISGCRVGVTDAAYARNCSGDRGHAGTRGADAAGATSLRAGGGSAAEGRWPANLIHDGSDEVVALFPAEAGAAAPVHKRNGDKFRNSYGAFQGNIDEAGSTFQGDKGSAARFFYCAKTSRKDRNEGLQDPGPQFAHGATLRQVENAATTGNTHPTVKPTDLMAYLCRLVTPPGGIVLDPFMGSGSTGKAAIREGFQFIGCELDSNYLAIAEARLKHEVERLKAASAAPASTQLDIFA